MPQEEESQERRKLVKALEIFESFTAEEWEEIRRAVKADSILRRNTERALAKLREIEALIKRNKGNS